MRKKMDKQEEKKIVVNVYSVISILIGLYYLYVCIGKAINVYKNNYTSFEYLIISLGIIIPIIIIGFSVYFFIKKDKVNEKVVFAYAIGLTVVGILQLFVNKFDVINSLYVLFDHNFKFTLYGLGVLPIIYLIFVSNGKYSLVKKK